MDIRTLNDNDLAELATRLVTLLTGTELSAIDSHVRADLVAAMGTLPADLFSHSAAQAEAESTKVAATSLKNTTRSSVLAVIGRLGHALKLGPAPKEQFDMCNIDFPVVRAAKYIAQDPSDISVYGFSNGINKGKFVGNNKSGRVRYEIWRRDGDDGVWQKHLLVTKQRFTDNGIIPGQYYEYRVRAIATQTVSNFSNSTVVYGVL